MTTKDLADTMQRCADALRKLEETHMTGEKPVFQGDYAVGAAIFWSYLRGLLTEAGKDVFTRDELLVLLEAMSRDNEMFPAGLFEFIGNLESEASA